MLIRTLWCKVGIPRPLERKSIRSFALSSLSEPDQHHKHAPQPWTSSALTMTSVTLPRNCYLNIHNPWQYYARCVTQALHGSQCLHSTLLADLGMFLKRTQSVQTTRKRLYSTNLAKTVLKSGLKSAVLPGKRIPKGPRTKQPSRTNQPGQDEDKVIPSSVLRDTDLCYIALIDQVKPVITCRICCSA